MTVNVSLLRKAVEWVEEQDKLPEIDREWVQGGWVTGPWNMAYNLVYEAVPLRRHEFAELANKLEPHCGTAYCVAGYIGQMHDARYAKADNVGGVPVAEYAEKLLGIEGLDHDLFEGTNTAADIRRIAEKLAGEKL